MSFSKFRSVLLVAFAVLTIIFGSISAYEFVQVQQLKSSRITTSTTTVTSTPSTTETWYTTSTITATSPVPKLPDEGEFEIVNMGTFEYKYVGDLQGGASVSFRNVTFYSMPLNTTITGCSVRYIRATFPDGTWERINVGWCYPIKISIQFTNHSNPRAGMIFAPRDYQSGETIVSSPLNAGIYVLVSV